MARRTQRLDVGVEADVAALDHHRLQRRHASQVLCLQVRQDALVLQERDHHEGVRVRRQAARARWRARASTSDEKKKAVRAPSCRPRCTAHRFTASTSGVTRLSHRRYVLSSSLLLSASMLEQEMSHASATLWPVAGSATCALNFRIGTLAFPMKTRFDVTTYGFGCCSNTRMRPRSTLVACLECASIGAPVMQTSRSPVLDPRRVAVEPNTRTCACDSPLTVRTAFSMLARASSHSVARCSENCTERTNSARLWSSSAKYCIEPSSRYRCGGSSGIHSYRYASSYRNAQLKGSRAELARLLPAVK
eukprot:Unigene11133_Nuclearia_a/m.34070 Unigene11133_Nuclearia_a/g.34070  ORF Unigene11133_Nuclearia_a/g.34070 Unigene11133_Nuclearia_a/m.34070 type:complete len:306 (+) Unigene11133_Nuclearia_a:370-1287(+)